MTMTTLTDDNLYEQTAAARRTVGVGEPFV